MLTVIQYHGMQIEECYRLLEVDPTASDEAVRAAWLDLTKVWHPDRFAHDPPLRAMAQERLKSINEAYETIVSARRSGIRIPAREPVRERLWHYGFYALLCVLGALLILVRRPTPGGLIISFILFVFAGLLIARMRRLDS
jgi:hypothetical protein